MPKEQTWNPVTKISSGETRASVMYNKVYDVTGDAPGLKYWFRIELAQL
jgi:hypothetical protein